MSLRRLQGALLRIATLGLLACTPATAAAQAAGVDSATVPPAETLRRVDKDLARAGRVRLVTHGGGVLVGEVRADDQGLHYGRVFAHGAADTLPVPGVIPWSRIVQIDRRLGFGERVVKRNAIQAGLALGVGGGLLAVSGGQPDASLVITTALGFGSGLVFGAFDPTIAKERLWARVYPTRRDMRRR